MFIDLGVLLFFFGSFLWGLYKGGVCLMFHTSGLLCGAFMGMRYGSWIMDFFDISLFYGRDVVGAVGVGILSFAVLSIVGHLVSRMVKGSLLSTADRIVGGIFSVLRSSVIILVLHALMIGIRVMPQDFFLQEDGDHPYSLRVINDVLRKSACRMNVCEMACHPLVPQAYRMYLHRLLVCESSCLGDLKDFSTSDRDSFA